jgi:hypothetical protein
VLKRLSESLERGQRQTMRRTRHVEERRLTQRPVHKAMDDVRTAHRDAMFHDEKSKTTVVYGEQGRAHAFNKQGRHVTSFVLKPAAVAFRMRTERWRPLTPDEVDEFRARIKEQLGRGEPGKG